MTIAHTAAIACLVSVAALLVADSRGWPAGRVAAKLLASTCFIAVALALGAMATNHGRLVLAALVLGWLGDALLLSHHARAFLAGLAAFLAAHVLFTAAFLTQPISLPAMGVAVVAAAAIGAVVLRWLLPQAPPPFKGPVLAYVVVILAMCVAAAGLAAATQRWSVLVGALLFAASDLAVARDRFVKEGFVNRLWGLPTYYLAQLVLASTVTVVPRTH